MLSKGPSHAFLEPKALQYGLERHPFLCVPFTSEKWCNHTNLPSGQLSWSTATAPCPTAPSSPSSLHPSLRRRPAVFSLLGQTPFPFAISDHNWSDSSSLSADLAVANLCHRDSLCPFVRESNQVDISWVPFLLKSAIFSSRFIPSFLGGSKTAEGLLSWSFFTFIAFMAFMALFGAMVPKPFLKAFCGESLLQRPC